MKVIKPSVEIIDSFDGQDVIRKLELCGRVCYKSEDKITDDSAYKFIENIIKRGHESVQRNCATGGGRDDMSTMLERNSTGQVAEAKS